MSRDASARPALDLRAVIAWCAVLISCSPSPPDRFRFVGLPRRFDLGAAVVVLQTGTQDVYAATFNGRAVRVKKGAASWEETDICFMQTAPDFQQSKAFGSAKNLGGVSGLVLETAAGFGPVSPPVGGSAGRLLGRDASGTIWSLHADTELQLSSWAVGSSAWATSSFAFDAGLADTQSALTSTGRFFVRLPNKGLFEADPTAGRLVERVPCSHSMFRASGTGFRACQQTPTVVGDLDGSVLIATTNHEVWRFTPGATEPVLAVKGDLQAVDTNGRSFIGPAQVHLDSKGRLWLLYRLGQNVDGDAAELHVADLNEAQPASWERVRGDLERNMRLFGVGPTPVLSTASEGQGLRVVRVEE